METTGRVTFSVVIPCYNAAQFIAETLETALGQIYAPLEVLVVDDGSTDATLEIVASFAERDARVRLLRTPAPSGGPSVPRNIGIAAARGDYIALLDADDWWSPSKLAHDARALNRHWPDILYSGAYTFEGTRDNVVHVLPSRKMSRRFEFKNYIPTSSIVIRKGYCEGTCEVFDPDPLMKIEDYHFLLTAYFSGASMRNRPGIDTYYRFHVDSSRVQRFDLSELLRRQFYNLSKLAMIHQLGLFHYYLLVVGVTLRIARRKLRGR
jgi:glycosyltransferase involved in cell wall biosynthesis